MEAVRYNYQKLRGLAIEHYGTLRNFAQSIGIGTTTLNSRLQGLTYFDQKEIETIAKSLKLTTMQEIDAVFFTHQ